MDPSRKIHDIIFVSDRIVTYKVAAAVLNVDVNEAKKLLQKYVKDTKSKGENLNVSYVIEGISPSGLHKIAIVSENKYQKIKSGFSSITVDHIYSIQKSPLVDWTPVFNVDDFIYEDKTSAEVIVKEEVDTSTKEQPVEKPQVKETVHKKGSLSSFFSQNTAKASKQPPKVKIEPGIKNGKSPKNGNIMSNFINSATSNNKENISNISNRTTVDTKVNVKVENDEDDEDEVVKVSKKRSRIINDDDDDDEIPTNKCQKTDILDDPMEEGSDVDIFGSPEKANFSDTEEPSEETEIIPSDVTEKETQSSVQSSAPEDTDNMYEDDDGYFVTEKKRGPKKPVEEKVPVLNKEEVEKKKKQEKQVKKELTQKLKNNTNQKTLFNFFQKK